MVQVLEKREKVSKKQTSSWEVEFDKRVKMSVEEQIQLRDSSWDKILAEGKALDEKLSKCEVLVTDEDEIADIVSKYRREQYETSLRS